jgi:NADPH:quinone reductase-like Zn-dependent oxidoreductase
MTLEKNLEKNIEKNTRYLARAQGQPLEVDAAPIPTAISADELLVRLKAIAINPADIKMIDQGHRVAAWPIVPGLDGAGIVEAVGEEVRNFAVGDKVLAQFSAGPAEKGGGSYQQFAIVQEAMAAKKPEELGWEEAASIPYVFPSIDLKRYSTSFTVPGYWPLNRG